MGLALHMIKYGLLLSGRIWRKIYLQKGMWVGSSLFRSTAPQNDSFSSLTGLREHGFVWELYLCRNWCHSWRGMKGLNTDLHPRLRTQSEWEAPVQMPHGSAVIMALLGTEHGWPPSLDCPASFMWISPSLSLRHEWHTWWIMSGSS